MAETTPTMDISFGPALSFDENNAAYGLDMEISGGPSLHLDSQKDDHYLNFSAFVRGSEFNRSEPANFDFMTGGIFSYGSRNEYYPNGLKLSAIGGMRYNTITRNTTPILGAQMAMDVAKKIDTFPTSAYIKFITDPVDGFKFLGLGVNFTIDPFYAKNTTKGSS